MPAPARFVPGLVLNIVAVVVALCMLPNLLLPMLKLGFLSLVTNPIVGLLAAVLAAVLIFGVPAVGMVLAGKGRRGFTIVTALASMGSLFALVSGLSSLGLSPLEREGHSSRPRPADCTLVTSDPSAVGRHCNPDGGEEPAGDCPAGYFCMEKVMMRPDSTECSILCAHDCECPGGLSCVFSKCVP